MIKLANDKRIAIKLASGFAILTLVACIPNFSASDASNKVGSFDTIQRITFFNINTDDHLLTLQGLCVLEDQLSANRVLITCKVGPEKYRTRAVGGSDLVAYYIEDLPAPKSGEYPFHVLFN